MNPPIVILTDFGTTDPFVGIMKGVLANIAPKNLVIDLTNEIPPGDIQRGAVTLWESLAFFPKGSIFLAVVDPGVGTNRPPIILKTQGLTFIGPDNGLFTFILGDTYQAWELHNPRLALQNPGMTFHGRDKFAPAAGHAAQGIPGPEFGDAILDLELIPLPKLYSPAPGEFHGQILHADRFGNLLTSFGTFVPSTDKKFRLKPWIGKTSETEFDLSNSTIQLPNGVKLFWASTFGQIPDGECAFILGSRGLLEIASNQQSASKLLRLHGGELVILKTTPEIRTGEEYG